MNLQVQWDGNRKRVKLLGLPLSTTLAELKEKVNAETSIPVANQTISSGFPPKKIADVDESALISSLGITNGASISVKEEVRQVAQPTPQLANAVSGALSSTEVAMDKNMENLIAMGFSQSVARQALSLADGNFDGALELCFSGGLEDDAAHTGSTGISSSTAGAASLERVMTRRVIDADNSCLFNSVGYCIYGSARGRKAAPTLRTIICEAVMTNPDVFSEPVLGKEPFEYCQWIMDPQKWAGEIEMVVLSDHFSIEIRAVDILTGKIYYYGQDKGHAQILYVIYDGIHYDALVEAIAGAPESEDITRFSTSVGPQKDAEAQAVAKKLRESKQYVDLAGCDLKCMVCGMGLRGQKGALEHAKATTHQNFGQI